MNCKGQKDSVLDAEGCYPLLYGENSARVFKKAPVRTVGCLQCYCCSVSTLESTLFCVGLYKGWTTPLSRSSPPVKAREEIYFAIINWVRNVNKGGAVLLRTWYETVHTSSHEEIPLNIFQFYSESHETY